MKCLTTVSRNDSLKYYHSPIDYDVYIGQHDSVFTYRISEIKDIFLSITKHPLYAYYEMRLYSLHLMKCDQTCFTKHYPMFVSFSEPVNISAPGICIQLHTGSSTIQGAQLNNFDIHVNWKRHAPHSCHSFRLHELRSGTACVWLHIQSLCVHTSSDKQIVSWRTPS